MSFKNVESQPDYVKQEEATLQWWEEQGVVEKYLHKNDSSDKKYRFLDGPITANNPMGVHHAHGRTIKDFFQRYKNMQGYQQRFQNGFDCQGLWVEVEEEKDLGFNSKRDIEAYGIDKFSLSCRARVERFSKVQANQSKRLGMFMDWDNSYYTMSENNNLHIWHFLQKIHEKGWIYKGVDAMPWCTRCGTAISQHELSDGGYKDVTHESVYVKFRISKYANKQISTLIGDSGSEDKYANIESASLLIWTTTPWTLLANVAVAVNTDLHYALVKVGSELLIVAKDRLNDVLDEYDEIVKEVSGKELHDILNSVEGSVYAGPFDELDAPSKVQHRMILWTDVTAEDGTGLVHIAPGAGKEDFELRKENGLDLLEPIDEFGDYVDGYGEFSKRNVFDVRADIYASLKEKGIFYKTASIFHSYPHCWRCKHELVFRTTSEWFIAADEIRPHMKKAAEGVNWMPGHAGKRMQDWLDNMGDWPISRKRYWGLALPFYEPSAGSGQSEGKFYVVGSKDELRELALDPAKVDALPELHRPWIDEVELDGTKIEINGEKQSGVWKRVKDVGDCWLDAGIVPFSTVDYLNNPEHWKEWYPFEFITEYVAQVKLWFYATLFMSVALEGQAPWKNVLATGFLVDEKGKAMHKSAGNAIAFDEAAGEVGADALRWLYLRERTANHYGTGDIRFGYTILHDVQRRFMNILWNTYRYFVTHATTQGWEPTEYNVQNAKSKSQSVLDRWILSRLYSVLKIVNASLDRFDSPTAVGQLETFVVHDLSQWYVRRSRERLEPGDRDAFLNTTYHVLHTLTRILAPFMPYLTEEMFQNLRLPTDTESVHLMDWPDVENFVDEQLEEQMALVRQIVEQGHSVRKQEGVRLRQPLQSVTVAFATELPKDLQDIIASELNVKEVHFDKQEGELQVSLDLNITEELQAEGAVREVLREIQNLRKNAGLSFDEKVVVRMNVPNDTLQGAIDNALSDLETRAICTVEFVKETHDLNDSSQIDTPLGSVSVALAQT